MPEVEHDPKAVEVLQDGPRVVFGQTVLVADFEVLLC